MAERNNIDRLFREKLGSREFEFDKSYWEKYKSDYGYKSRWWKDHWRSILILMFAGVAVISSVYFLSDKDQLSETANGNISISENQGKKENKARESAELYENGDQGESTDNNYENPDNLNQIPNENKTNTNLIDLPVSISSKNQDDAKSVSGDKNEGEKILNTNTGKQFNGESKLLDGSANVKNITLASNEENDEKSKKLPGNESLTYLEKKQQKFQNKPEALIEENDEANDKSSNKSLAHLEEEQQEIHKPVSILKDQLISDEKIGATEDEGNENLNAGSELMVLDFQGIDVLGMKSFGIKHPFYLEKNDVVMRDIDKYLLRNKLFLGFHAALSMTFNKLEGEENPNLSKRQKEEKPMTGWEADLEIGYLFNKNWMISSGFNSFQYGEQACYKEESKVIPQIVDNSYWQIRDVGYIEYTDSFFTSTPAPQFIYTDYNWNTEYDSTYIDRLDTISNNLTLPALNRRNRITYVEIPVAVSWLKYFRRGFIRTKIGAGIAFKTKVNSRYPDFETETYKQVPGELYRDVLFNISTAFEAGFRIRHSTYITTSIFYRHALSEAERSGSTARSHYRNIGLRGGVSFMF